jgi:hypothetical protein
MTLHPTASNTIYEISERVAAEAKARLAWARSLKPL